METITIDNYLPKKIAIRLAGVGERMLRNYVAEGRLARRYHIKGGMYDLVCYKAEDVLRIAEEKGYVATLSAEDREQMLAYENTYPEKTKDQKVIAEPTAPQAIAAMQTEVILTQITTPLVNLCDTLKSIEDLLKNPQKKQASKLQSYATIACVFVWSCIMVYVAIFAI